MPSGVYGLNVNGLDSTKIQSGLPLGELGYTNYSICSIGYECELGEQFPCQPGTYSSAVGQSACVACGKNGGYNLLAGLSSCLPVPVGWYGIGSEEDALAFSSISRCPAGAYCVGGVLTQCGPGTVQARPQSTFCNACATGEYQDTAGETVCKTCTVSCPPGLVPTEVASLLIYFCLY